ncbi:MAG: glycosyltransferase [Bifidobacteriaceae bacterium]|nr:glycosyltransferase [Bifidobacteriaceae bacterium]
MRIVIVGPTHPHKGGIAQHTTRLAHELAAGGHDVSIESWSRQYPKLLYPGQLTVPDRHPEIEPFGTVHRDLAWNAPSTWRAAGKRAATADAVIIPVTTPVQVPAFCALRRFAGSGPRVVALMHNVLPHERRPWDKPLIRSLLTRVHAVLVHLEEQRQLASTLTSAPVAVTPIPANLPADTHPAAARTHADQPLRVLAFGMVRPYKGVDVLLRAAATLPHVQVTIAGEFWTPEAHTRALIHTLGIGDRVDIISGYIPAERVSPLFNEHDVVALPYRHGVGSGNLQLALAHARPLLVSRVGSFAEDIGEGRFGVVVEPGDVASVADGLHRLSRPMVFNAILEELGSERTPNGHHGDQWRAYARTLLALCQARPAPPSSG